jgi:choline kinase
MSHPPILLTTSGTGSRLGPLTKYTNKSLVKVGDKYAICRILDMYPEDAEYIITLGYFGSHVKDFLELAYPTRNFTFVNIDPYEGSGSSLGYSMLQAKSYLERPFIFHCCDTIFTSPVQFPTNGTNSMVVTKSTEYQTYSSVTVTRSCISTVHPKGYEDNDYIYTGVSYIHDHVEFWNYLEEEYKKNPSNQSLSDIHALMHLVKLSPMYPIVLDTHKVFDTGNLLSYEKACKAFGSNYYVLEKNTESLCFFNDRVIKFIHDAEINKKRVHRGMDLYPLVPKIIGSRDHFMCMELVPGTILSEYKEYGHIKGLLEWAQQHLWSHTCESPNFADACRRFYKDKTYERISKLSWLKEERRVVNGIHTGSIYDLLNKVNFDSLATTTFTKFHGDFILDNILKVEGYHHPYCLLDWRHEFDKELEHGDRLYDLAKLRHNIIFNHGNITQGLFNIFLDDKSATVDLKCNYILIKQLDDFNSFLKAQHIEYRQVELLTGLIWLNMAPLYEGDLSYFLFYFGKLNVHLALHG